MVNYEYSLALACDKAMSYSVIHRHIIISGTSKWFMTSWLQIFIQLPFIQFTLHIKCKLIVSPKKNIDVSCFSINYNLPPDRGFTPASL